MRPTVKHGIPIRSADQSMDTLADLRVRGVAYFWKLQFSPVSKFPHDVLIQGKSGYNKSLHILY